LGPGPESRTLHTIFSLCSNYGPWAQNSDTLRVFKKRIEFQDKPGYVLGQKNAPKSVKIQKLHENGPKSSKICKNAPKSTKLLLYIFS